MGRPDDAIPLPNKENTMYDEDDGYCSCQICMDTKTGDTTDPLSKHPCTVVFPCLHVYGHGCACVASLRDCPTCRKQIRDTFVWRGNQYDDAYKNLLKRHNKELLDRIKWDEGKWRRERDARMPKKRPREVGDQKEEKGPNPMEQIEKRSNVGDRVVCRYSDNKWYPATVRKVGTSRHHPNKIRIEWDDTKGRFYWMPLEKVRPPSISCRYHAGMYGFDSTSNILPKLTEEFTDYPTERLPLPQI